MNNPMMVNRATGAGTPRQRRFGLMRAAVGFALIRRDENAREAQFQVRERRLFPEAKCVVTCTTCKRDFKDMKTAEASHPAHEIMRRRQEAHVLAYWSDDIDQTSIELHDAWERTRALAKETGQVFTQEEPPLLPIGYLADSE